MSILYTYIHTYTTKQTNQKKRRSIFPFVLLLRRQRRLFKAIICLKPNTQLRRNINRFLCGGVSACCWFGHEAVKLSKARQTHCFTVLYCFNDRIENCANNSLRFCNSKVMRCSHLFNNLFFVHNNRFGHQASG